jgi:hypothetical protein
MPRTRDILTAQEASATGRVRKGDSGLDREIIRIFINFEKEIRIVSGEGRRKKSIFRTLLAESTSAKGSAWPASVIANNDAAKVVSPSLPSRDSGATRSSLGSPCRKQRKVASVREKKKKRLAQQRKIYERVSSEQLKKTAGASNCA